MFEPLSWGLRGGQPLSHTSHLCLQRSQDGRGLQGRPSKSAVAAAQEAKQGPGPGAQVNGEASLDHDTDDYTDYMDQDSMEYHQSAEGPAAKK